MGIVNHDPYENRFTVDPISDTYICIGGNPVAVHRDQAATFRCACTYFVYWSHQAKEAGKDAIGVLHLEDTLAEVDIKGKDIYSVCYDILKKKFPNFTDK